MNKTTKVADVLAVVIVGVIMLGVSAQAAYQAGNVLLLNDTFSDGSRLQTEATDTEWFRNHTTLVTVPASELQTAGAGVATLAYTRGGAYTIEDGRWLALTFELKFTTGTTDSTAGISFGLYDNSGEARIATTTDPWDGTPNPQNTPWPYGDGTNPPDDDPGYTVNIGKLGTSVARTLLEESGTNGTIMGGTDRATTPNTYSYTDFVNDQYSSVELILTRVGTSLQFDLYKDTSLLTTWTDLTPQTFTFDTIIITDGIGGAVQFDNIMVFAVPEPASIALLGGLCLFALRRRRRCC